MMYVLELPILSCKHLGEVKHTDESGSKNCELHLHFANMKPPESFNFGNAACNSSRNSSPEQSTSSMTIFFSPSPASNKASFSLSVVGMMSWAQQLKQTNLCAHVLAARLQGCFAQ